MKKEVLYQYIGTNGTILSPVHLEDTYYVRKLRIVADEGMILTCGGQYCKETIIAEDNLSSWEEVPEGQE